MAESTVNGGVATTAPDVVRLYKEDLVQIGFTGRELAAIKQHTGHSLSELLSDEATDDKFIVLAWLKLRRDGQNVSWEDMLDVVVDFQPTESLVDPQNAASFATSPPSVTSGA
jgi:hypothetical protein